MKARGQLNFFKEFIYFSNYKLLLKFFLFSDKEFAALKFFDVHFFFSLDGSFIWSNT